MSKSDRPIERVRVPEAVANMLNAGDITLPYHICGSFRRGRAIINDIDVVLVCNSLEDHARAEAGLVQLFGRQANGRPKRNGEFAGANFDIHTGFAYSLGALLLHATGCWQFNRWLRREALFRNWTLNQYGLYDMYGDVILQSPDEHDFFNKLDCPWFEPEDREDSDFFALS